MPRKQRCRFIESYPDYWEFSPDEPSCKIPLILSLDEYECIRLIDREGLTQEQCALKMDVSRTTVTAIYDSARKKIAQSLVDGRILKIGGGAYTINDSMFDSFKLKGDKVMRLAVTYENGEVFQHFGHTEQFKIYDIEDGKIKETRIVDTNGSGHGALAGFLKAGNVDALICGGIGMGAINALSEAEIKLFPGVSGNADAAVNSYIDGKLEFNPDAHCDHHDHHEGHDCGNHGHGGCSENKHGCAGHDA